MSFVFQAFSNQVYKATINIVSKIEEIGQVSSDSSSRWFNVVLDLNGILCACERAWKTREFRNIDFCVHSAMMPMEVFKKFVLVRPRLFI